MHSTRCLLGRWWNLKRYGAYFRKNVSMVRWSLNTYELSSMTTIQSESKIVTVSLDHTEVIFVQSYIIYTQYVNATFCNGPSMLILTRSGSNGQWNVNDGMTHFEDGRTALWADRCELRKKSLGQQIILELANKEREYYGIFSSHSEGPLKYNSTTLFTYWWRSTVKRKMALWTVRFGITGTIEIDRANRSRL